MGLSPFFLSGAYYQEHATTRLFAVSLVRPVCLVCLVCLVSLIRPVCLVSPISPVSLVRPARLVRLPAATLDAGAFPVHIFGLVSSVIRTGFSRGEAVWPRISGPAC